MFTLNVPTNLEPHLILNANVEGRDIHVGDLHGCYEDLIRALDAINFDGTVDRVICCGDLVDRGPDTLKCISLLNEEWFYSVRGNHEQLFIDSLTHPDYVQKRRSFEIHIMNGGKWQLEFDEKDAIKIANKLSTLPFMISVRNNLDPDLSSSHTVHAELRKQNGKPVTEEMIRNWDFTSAEMLDMMWLRETIAHPKTFTGVIHCLGNVPIFVGHTPVREPTKIGLHNYVYIDTGATFYYWSKSLGQSLTLYDNTNQIIYSFDVETKKISHKEAKDIRQL